jgi:magnesium transporter
MIMKEEPDLAEIKHLLVQRNWRELSHYVSDWLDPEVADLLLHLDKSERVLLYRLLPRGRAADIFAHLDHEDQDAFLGELSDEETRQLLAHLSPDDRTALLEELPAEVTQKLMRLLSPEDLAEARQLLGYPEESVGRLMTPDYIAVRRQMTIAEALDHIRRTGKDRETFNIIYVTDESGRLLDALRLRRFIMASPNAKVESVMDDTFISLSAFDDREKAVQVIQRYDLFALPVVDSEGVLIGIVTVDDVLDVAQEEATEDFHKGAGVAPLEMPYSSAMPGFLYRKRIGWLTILIFVNLISAQIIANYEEYIQQFFVLAFFMPLLIASGGNAGAQSATLMVRALATGDMRLDRWRRAFGKEMLVGVFLGGTTGVLTYFLGFFRGGLEIGLVVGLSMVSIVVVANLIGVLLPFTLTRLKLDPAVASSPLITSMMDAIGLFIYFGIATAVLTLT